MANISDYLDWRGDITFFQDPFNEVDNLILSELAYTDFDGIVPGEDSEVRVTIQQACRDFFERYTEEEILSRQSTTKMAPFLMKKMASSRRFERLLLGKYVNEIDQENQSQFSAVLLYLEDGTVYAAYRGTDNTIVGWKEDFNMGFLYQTAGQMRAAVYLNERFQDSSGPIRVGGHSKGGNFAVYAAAFAREEIQKRILQVYSNDGPGFLSQILETEGYRRILPKVKSTIPEASIVGMLLENHVKHTVVKSSQTGAYQHDAMSWEVLGNRFVRAKTVSESSILWDKTISNWLIGLSRDEREEFVDVIFGILESTGARTFEELSESRIRSLGEMRGYLAALSPEKQKAVREILLKFAISGGESVKEKIRSVFKK